MNIRRIKCPSTKTSAARSVSYNAFTLARASAHQLLHHPRPLRLSHLSPELRGLSGLQRGDALRVGIELCPMPVEALLGVSESRPHHKERDGKSADSNGKHTACEYQELRHFEYRTICAIW